MYQQITLVGNLGNDPEMRYTPSGVPVTSFSLAINKSWTDQNGQRQERTTWFRISAWRKQAEVCAQYLSKGRQVMVIGEVDEARAWTDQEGNQRASLDVTAQMVKFLGSPNDNTNGYHQPAAVAERVEATPAVAIQAAAGQPVAVGQNGSVPPGAQLVDDDLFGDNTINENIPF